MEFASGSEYYGANGSTCRPSMACMKGCALREASGTSRNVVTSAGSVESARADSAHHCHLGTAFAHSNVLCFHMQVISCLVHALPGACACLKQSACAEITHACSATTNTHLAAPLSATRIITTRRTIQGRYLRVVVYLCCLVQALSCTARAAVSGRDGILTS